MKPGDTVAIWGCGPVGQMAIQSAWLQGAEQVVAFDHVPERLEMAKTVGKAAVFNFMDCDPLEELNKLTKGRGPASVIDCVGSESHGLGSADAVVDRVKAATGLSVDRPHVWRDMVKCVRAGGIVSSPGVYFGYMDKFPLGSFVGKGLTARSGQTHVQKYMDELMADDRGRQVRPELHHHASRHAGRRPGFYETFKNKKDNCIKCVMTPGDARIAA